MELYPGKKVRVKKYKYTPRGWNDQGHMNSYMGKIVTIKDVNGRSVHIVEDNRKKYHGDTADHWTFYTDNFEEIKYEFEKELPGELFNI